MGITFPDVKNTRAAGVEGGWQVHRGALQKPMLQPGATEWRAAYITLEVYNTKKATEALELG